MSQFAISPVDQTNNRNNHRANLKNFQLGFIINEISNESARFKHDKLIHNNNLIKLDIDRA